jgi:hypothetical protein
MSPFSSMYSMHCRTTMGSAMPSWQRFLSTATSNGTPKIGQSSEGSGKAA